MDAVKGGRVSCLPVKLHVPVYVHPCAGGNRSYELDAVLRLASGETSVAGRLRRAVWQVSSMHIAVHKY